MEQKKTPKADLENKRNSFVLLGLVLSLAVVLTAFNITDSVKKAESFGELQVEEVEEEIIPITRVEPVKPPPPPPPVQVLEVLNIVDDDVEIDEEIDFDSEADEDTFIDAVPVITDEEDDADEAEVFVVVEDMPEFPGGEIALRNWINKNVKYPVVATENGIQGKVYVMFVVTKTGAVADVRIGRGVAPSLDKEALRVVNQLPKFKPGMQRGKPVNVSYTVPINFQLQ